MATPQLTDEQFFGGQGYAYGPGAPESGQAPTPEQQTYARAMAQHLDRGAPVGTPQNPSYDTPTAKADASIYHVGADGKLYDPVATAQAATKPVFLSDEQFFGGNNQDFVPGQQFDTRPTSQGLGAAEGAFTVGKNVTSALTGDLPTATPSIDKLNLMMHPMALAGRLGIGMLRGQLDKAEETQRPGQIGKVGTEFALTLPLAAIGEGTPALVGALQGGLTSEAKTPGGRLLDVGLGAVGGKVGDSLMKGAGGMIRPTVRPEAQWALDNGIRLTPGAIAGGFPRTMEAGAGKGLFAGSMIGAAQQRGIEDFNLATIQKNVLDPAGLKLPEGIPAGHQAVNAATRALSDSYDALTPNLVLSKDADLLAAVKEAQDAAKTLPSAYRNRLTSYADQLGAKRGVALSGDQVQELTATLRQEAADAQRSGDFFTAPYGRALDKLNSAVSGALERSNPNYADQLRGLNQGYAALVRVQRAALNATQNEGVFTPKDLLSAVRSTDQSVRDNATARGEALLQDWANSGKAVLPDKVNDRLPPLQALAAHLPELLVTAGVGKESGLGAAAMAFAGLEGATGGLYTEPAQRALAALLTQRPAAAKPIADAVNYLRPYAAHAASVGTVKGLLPWSQPTLAETIAPMLNYSLAAPQAQARQLR